MASLPSSKTDLSLLSKTLFKLGLPRLFIYSLLTMACVLAWAWAARWMLHFGDKQDYAFLQRYSTQVADYLNHINQYIWWGLVLLGTFILYFILYSIISSGLKAAGAISPRQEVIERLLTQLSPHAKDVLIWVWQEQREPITIKDLKETRRQLRANRVSLLEQINQQRILLGLPPTQTAPDTCNQAPKHNAKAPTPPL